VEPFQFPTVPLEWLIAEKVHAYTRTYGASGHPSTRVKDLVDIVLVGGHAALRAGNVRFALRTTFETRATHPLPIAIPAPPTAWRMPYRVLAASTAIDTDLAEGHRRAAAFLDPVLGTAVADAALWDPVQRRWKRLDEG
jgi:hypothetical protein